MDTLSVILCIGGVGAAAYGLSKGKRGHTTLLAGAAAAGVGLVRAARGGEHAFHVGAAKTHAPSVTKSNQLGRDQHRAQCRATCAKQKYGPGHNMQQCMNWCESHRLGQNQRPKGHASQAHPSNAVNGYFAGVDAYDCADCADQMWPAWGW